MTCYAVRDWNTIYENSESRKIRACRYVCTPNKHDGKSYGRMMAHPEGERLFAAWNAIIQVASKMPSRGILKDQDGILTASDLHFKTRLKVETFEMALVFFSSPEIGWLVTEVSESSEIPGHPDISGQLPDAPGKNGLEGKGREGKGTEGNRNNSLPLPPPDVRAGICIRAYPQAREGERGKEILDWTEKERGALIAKITASPMYPFELVFRRAGAGSLKRVKNPGRFLEELPVLDQLLRPMWNEFLELAKYAARDFKRQPRPDEDYLFHLLMSHVRSFRDFEAKMAELFDPDAEA